MISLNKIQKIIASIGLIAIVLSCLIPPWTYTFNAEGIYSEKPAGYSHLWYPPEPERSHRAFGLKVDMARLSIQILLFSIASIFGIFLFTTKKKQGDCEQDAALDTKKRGSSEL